MEFLHPTMWHDHDIDFVRWLHPAMWHVALESWQWIHQVAAPCNVICGSGITCHWICPNVRHIGILHLVSISIHHRSRHVILQNFIQIGQPLAEKMTSCRFSRWRISAILDFMGPIMGSLKSPCTTSYRSSTESSSKLLTFWQNRVFSILAIDRRTDKHPMREAAVSLSRAAA